MIDHAGLIVPDLAAAMALLDGLGLVAVDRPDHTAPGPDGTPVPTGSSQHSVMFAHGWIEVMAITDRSRGHVMQAAADRYTGMHILALETFDVPRCVTALADRGVAVSAPQGWSRPVRFGDADGEARFTFVSLPMDESPEGMVAFVHQQAPVEMRPPGSTDQPNGARGLAEVVLCTDDVAAAAARYAKWLGAEPADDDGAVVVSDGTDAVRICTHDWLADHTGGCRGPAATAFAGIGIRVTDLDDLRRRLDAAGHRWGEDGPGLWCDLRRELGVVLRGEEAR